jgi:hypothetical protein
MGKEHKAERNQPASSQDLPVVKLPKPSPGRGRSLFQALLQRKTIRALSVRRLSPQLISNLLWAAWGVNRKKGPFGISGRTAASASNSQEIDLYVAMQKGIYLYDAFGHRLVPVASGDRRTLAIGRGQPAGGAKAPVHLIYVADVDRLVHTSGFQEPGLRDPEIQKSYFYVDTGLIAANVHLFAAAQGLAAWFHHCRRDELARVLGLRRDQLVLFAQTVGYPA